MSLVKRFKVVHIGDNPIYLGDPNTDGSWRFYVVGTDLLAQRRESSVWVTKGAYNA